MANKKKWQGTPTAPTRVRLGVGGRQVKPAGAGATWARREEIKTSPFSPYRRVLYPATECKPRIASLVLRSDAERRCTSAWRCALRVTEHIKGGKAPQLSGDESVCAAVAGGSGGVASGRCSCLLQTTALRPRGSMGHAPQASPGTPNLCLCMLLSALRCGLFHLSRMHGNVFHLV